MTPTLVLLGQLLGLSFACGLNLYAAVAALGILSRAGIIDGLPPGLIGLESFVVIGSALTLYIIEAVVDKVRLADSLWDTIHTFIRPPAAALLAIGALWALPLQTKVAGAAFAFAIALTAHGTKAGLRMALNTAQQPGGHTWISVAEDVAAVAFAVAALQAPAAALVAGGLTLLVLTVIGPRLWRAFALGMRCLTAWVRSIFAPARWREVHELPGDLQALLDRPALGTAAPRGTRAGLHGVRGVGAYRNGWLVITTAGPVFLYRTLFGARRANLPAARDLDIRRGAWVDVVHITTADAAYTLYMLKDGPAVELAVDDLQPAAA